MTGEPTHLRLVNGWTVRIGILPFGDTVLTVVPTHKSYPPTENGRCVTGPRVAEILEFLREAAALEPPR